MSTTGIPGMTLHGGYGHLRRKYGLNIDNLLSAEIVTADGQVRTASRSDNVDLFWALRGAGSNFGVVTSLLDMSGPISFTAVQAAFDPFFPKGRLYYWKSTNVHDLSDACIDTILAAAAARPSYMSDIPIWHLGGALSRDSTSRSSSASAMVDGLP